MGTTTKSKIPDLIFRNGKPTGVILDIEDYEEILERLEDIEDLEELREMRKKPLEFHDLEDVLIELGSDE